jgi:hypothetical protein
MIVSLEAADLPVDVVDDQPEPRRRETTGVGRPAVADGPRRGTANEELLRRSNQISI